VRTEGGATSEQSILPIQLLRPMRTVSVEVSEGSSAGTYSSLVLDFEEDESILVGAPLERGREVKIEPKTPVLLHFAQPDGIHVLSTHVLERTPGQPSLRLAWPDGTEHIQRRSFARVEILVRCTLDVQDHAGGEDQSVPALSTDLSVGGVRVTMPVALEPDTQVRITMDLPGLGERTCEGLVNRTGETEGAAQNHRFWAALEFAGMLESVRDDLTHFLLGAQREQQRKSIA